MYWEKSQSFCENDCFMVTLKHKAEYSGSTTELTSNIITQVLYTQPL